MSFSMYDGMGWVFSTQALLSSTHKYYAIYHGFVELLSIVIAYSLFVTTWHSRRRINNSYFLLLGVAYLFIAGLDAFHILSYNLGVIPNSPTMVLSAQMQLSSRYLEVCSFLIAIACIQRRIVVSAVFTGYAIVFVIILTILFGGFFSQSFTEGQTSIVFTSASEYVISGLLLVSLLGLSKNQSAFHETTLTLLKAAMLLTLFGSLSKLFSPDEFTATYMLGQLCKPLSYYCVYRALIQTHHAAPYQFLFRNLQQSERQLTKHRDRLNGLLEKRTKELESINEQLSDEIEQRRKAEIELHKSEQRLKAHITANPDMMFVFDERGVYQEFYAKEHQLYDQKNDILGKHVSDNMPPNIANWVTKVIPQVLANENEIKFLEYDLDLPMGKAFYRARMVRSTEKQALAIVTDITEQVTLEKQIRHSQKMEAIGVLTGGIAHEFNNLLSPILGFTELLLMSKTQEDPERDDLKQIQIAGLRAKRLIQQMLAFGQKSFSQKESVHLQNLIKNALTFLQNTIPENIICHTELQEDLPPVFGMPNEIHQVILNLCINAYQAMPRGGELTISLKKQNRPYHKAQYSEVYDDLVLVVKDTGTGIPQELLERIYDPFFTTKEVGEGSGLGLSVVKGIVEQHQGTIIIESMESSPASQSGTTVSVYLPISEGIPIKIPKKITSPTRGNERILLIDDEEIIIHLTQKVLEKQGYTVQSFLNCEKALKLFEQQPNHFDLVLTDFGMPQMNGKQLALKIKKLRSDIPIVIFTGYGDAVAKEEMDLWGVDELLMKPFEVGELSEVLRKVLNRPSKKDKLLTH